VQDIRLMFDTLRAHVQQRITLTADEFFQCTSLMVARRVRKDAYLLQAGEVSKHLAFVTKGCLRSYSIDKKGQEHILQFAVEGWWISDLYSFLTGKESTFFIDALEESDVLLLDKAGYEKLSAEVPKFEKYWRILLSSNYIATHRRVLATISLSAEERYLQLVEECSSITQRVAQRHIASFLGITPEALSRIRNRIAKRQKTATVS
jgi:CRP-like cAMP-binding protein